MRKNYVLIIVLLWVSCSKKKQSESTPNVADSIATSQAKQVGLEEHYSFSDSLLIGYQQFINQLDPSDADNVNAATRRFKFVFKERSKETCDSAFYIFNDFYNKVDNKVNEIHYSSQGNNDSLLFILFVDPPKYKLSKKQSDYLDKLKNNGFSVHATEGQTYINKNRDFIKENFNNSLTMAMVNYLDQLNRENKEGFGEDGGIIIKPSMLVDRIVWWERFVEENPNFIFRKDLAYLSHTYLRAIITGQDNTPLFANYGRSGKLSDYFNEAYTYLFTKYPNSLSAKLLMPYYSALTKNDTTAMQNFRARNL